MQWRPEHRRTRVRCSQVQIYISLAGVPGPTMVAPQPHCHAAAQDVSNDHYLKVDSCLGVPPAVNLSAVGWLNSCMLLGRARSAHDRDLPRGIYRPHPPSLQPP